VNEINKNNYCDQRLFDNFRADAVPSDSAGIKDMSSFLEQNGRINTYFYKSIPKEIQGR
jgi:hypothetical protein